MNHQRPGLINPANFAWFNIFAIRGYLFPDVVTTIDKPLAVFEVVSAYGTVGLSLGLPTVGLLRALTFRVSLIRHFQANYSLCGVFHPLSKLIICLVMLRGRHRGLPVAIDRAVMLPELKLDDEMTLQRRMSHITNPAATEWSPRGEDGASLRPAPTIQTSSIREGT